MASNDEEQRLGKWMDLMDDDLQMKVRELRSDRTRYLDVELMCFSKQIIKEDQSLGNPRACDVGDALFIEFVARTAEKREQRDGTIFQKVEDWLVVVGDKDVIPALEMGLRFMQQGETALIYSKSKYAYGPTGRKEGKFELQPNSNVCYEVRIKKIVWDTEVLSSPDFQIEIARSKKLIGNDCYKYEWSEDYGKNRALLLYNKAAQSMSNLLTDIDDENTAEEATKLMIECLNNMAAVYLKSKEYGKAKETATKVILRDPDNLKALLRAARAAIYDPAGTFEESKAAIKAAEQVSPDDKDLRNLKIEFERKKKEYKKRSKEFFSKMGSGMTSSAQPANETKAFPQEQGKENTKPTSTEDNGSKDQDTVPKCAIVEETELKGTWRKYFPYIVQLVAPFVIYYIFTLLNPIPQVNGI